MRRCEESVSVCVRACVVVVVLSIVKFVCFLSQENQFAICDFYFRDFSLVITKKKDLSFYTIKHVSLLGFLILPRDATPPCEAMLAWLAVAMPSK